MSVTHWQNKMSRDEDDDASLVVINSGISALSNAEHSHFCPSHQGCLHSREKTGSYSLPRLIFFLSELLTVGVFKAVCAFPIISFLPPPMLTQLIQLSLSRSLTIRGGNQSAASLSSPFPSPLSPPCPRRGFCCCISALLLCVQEEPRMPWFVFVHRLKQTWGLNTDRGDV